jgi:uncharacterized repeat protein (TIGR02543 family)
MSILRHFTLALLLMIGFGSWGQVDIIPRLYLISKNNPSGVSGWTISKARINNATPDDWKMLNTNAFLETPAFSLDAYSDENCTIKLGTFGSGTAATQTITVSISTNNGSSWTNLTTFNPTSSSSNTMPAIDLSSYTGSQVKLKFANLGGTSTVGVRFFEAKISGNLTNTVTFNSNGGSGTMSPQSSSTSVSLTPNTFINNGFIFNGWNTASDGSGQSYADQGIYNFSANLTLYAQWTSYATTQLAPPRSEEHTSELQSQLR